MSTSRKHQKKFIIIKRSIVIVTTLMIFFVGIYLVTKNFEEDKTVTASTINKNKPLNTTKIDNAESITNSELVINSFSVANKNKPSIKIEDAESITNTNSESVINGLNVTKDGNKYAFDAEEVRDVLAKRQIKVDGKKIAFLTFDDGPSTTVTPMILKILNENNVHATFFVVGQAINKKTEEILREELKQGHSIGNHTYSHDYDYLYPNRVVNINNFMSEINKTNEILKNVLGNNFHTRVIRMPGGHMSWSKNISAFDNVLNENKYISIDWNDYTKDSEGPTKNKKQLIDVLKEYYLGNDRLVVLMHDTYGKESTAEALPEVIKFLKEQGYEFKTLK